MINFAQVAAPAGGLSPGTRLWSAAIVTLAFTLLARWVRGVTFSGAIAGAVVCFVLYAAVGAGAFAALVTVFALTWISTRLGYKRKQKLGTAERREGRTASQVLANLAVAAGCAGLAAISGEGVFVLATAAALSEAAADTVSSEVGQARNETARLITTWEEVPAGTDGGISVAGTMAGLGAAVLVNAVCAVSGLLPRNWLGLSVLAAAIGMMADSYFGATFERRKLLNNDWVNFLSTAIAAGLAFLLA